MIKYYHWRLNRNHSYNCSFNCLLSWGVPICVIILCIELTETYKWVLNFSQANFISDGMSMSHPTHHFVVFSGCLSRCSGRVSGTQSPWRWSCSDKNCCTPPSWQTPGTPGNHNIWNTTSTIISISPGMITAVSWQRVGWWHRPHGYVETSEHQICFITITSTFVPCILIMPSSQRKSNLIFDVFCQPVVKTVR